MGSSGVPATMTTCERGVGRGIVVKASELI